MLLSQFRLLLVLVSLIFVIACTPDDDFAESPCPPVTNDPVRITLLDDTVVTDPELARSLQINSLSTPDHQLYIKDLLTAMEPKAESLPLDADAEAITTFFRELLDEAFDYDGPTADITSTNNSLDFMEFFIQTTNDDLKIGYFEFARQAILDAVERDDNVCFQQNNNIIVNVENSVNDDVVQYPYIVAFDYIPDVEGEPGTARTSQLIIQNPTQEDLLSLEGRQSSPFISRAEYDPDDYTLSGYVKPLKLEVFYQKNEGLDQLVLTDEPALITDLDLNVIDLAYLSLDDACEDEDGEAIDCVDGTITRTPQLSECVDSDTNRYELRTFDIGTLTGLKRVRLEVDFEAEETRLFASNFVEAVEDPGTGETITDPTECEIRQILTEVNGTSDSALWTEPAVRILDPNYDFDAESPPTPLAVYSGLPVTSRKTD